MWDDQLKDWKENSSIGGGLIGVGVRKREKLEITVSFKCGDL